jgi:hypothetical protein
MQPTLSHQNSKGASNLNLQAKNSPKKKKQLILMHYMLFVIWANDTNG